MRPANLIILSGLLLTCFGIKGEIPQLITFQGKLFNAQSNLLAGTYNVTFRLYEWPTNGVLLWQETHTNVSVTRGVFAVPLGIHLPFSLPFDRPYWVSIAVDNDAEMAPRQQLNAAPYALRSRTSALADSALTLNGAAPTQLGFVPIGSIIAWAKSFQETPALPANFRECNGQTLNDPDSPLNGRPLPDLNIANRFLRGSLVSGATGGVEKVSLSISNLPGHNHGQIVQANINDSSLIVPAYRIGGGGEPGRYGIQSVQPGGIATGGIGRLTTEDAGGNQPHENRPPFYDVVWIIRVK